MNTGMKGPRDPEDDGIRRLIEDAGPREEISQDELDQLENAARGVWRAKVRRRRGKLFRGFALAAALLILVVGGILLRRSAPGSVTLPAVAHFERVRGDVVSIDEGRESVTAGDGMEVHVGDRIRVSDGIAALEIGDAVSLRLAAFTTVRVVDPTRIELSNGAVYVDTDGQGGSLEVTTPLGSARDIGTQFLVRLGDDAETLSVSVRDGEVVVRHQGVDHSVADGTTLAVLADGRIERAETTGWGSDWTWVLDAAPRLVIEGRTLAEYLEWVEQETGLVTRFEDPSLEQVARETTLHGSTGDLRPDKAVLVVLPGAGLEGSIENGWLDVRKAD